MQQLEINPTATHVLKHVVVKHYDLINIPVPPKIHDCNPPVVYHPSTSFQPQTWLQDGTVR